MASVDWLKRTKQAAGALQRHNNQDKRQELEHSNPDIDKSRTHLNYCIGCRDYADAYKAMCKRVDEVDAINPPLKKVDPDKRIVCHALETPCPEEIYKAGRSEEFFNELHKVFQDFFGAENVNGTCVHLDEIHNYIDKDGKEKTSLAHAHTLVTDYVEWTDKVKDKQTKEVTIRERKGINGKNFETIPRLNALNKAVNDMVLEKFGVAFNTGELARKEKTEVLKARSELAAAKKATDDYIRSVTPSPTKTVKGLFGEKEVTKTDEELEHDKMILAAQDVLRRGDERAQELDRRKQNVEEMERAQALISEQNEQERQRLASQKEEQEKAYTDKEKRLKEEVRQQAEQQANFRFNQLMNEHDNEIKAKQQTIVNLDKKIAFKEKMAANVTAKFWGKADYLTRADENQRAFEEHLRGGAGRDRNYVQATSNRGR